DDVVTAPTDARPGSSGDGTGDMFAPWPGGPAYYARFSHGLRATPDFFPVAVWLQSPRNAARYAAIGINVFVGQYDPPTAASLAMVHAANITVGCDQTPSTLGLAGSDPTIVMWTHDDEPDNAQALPGGGYGPCITPAALVGRYNQFRMNDATRPV